MNTCVLVGRVGKYPGAIYTISNSATRFISCQVSYIKKFGTGKTFEKRFKVLMFGKQIDEVVKQLQPGTLVAVSGEVDIDFGKDGSNDKPCLKIVGNISILEAAAAKAPPPKEPDDEPPEEDHPF